MEILNLIQGSAEWHAHRATSRNASDAPAVLGCSPYMTRGALLKARHSGIRREVSPEQQRRFDRGHAIEAAKRPAAEAIIGEDLYPCVGTETVDGIELSGSFDGLTMLEDTNWECKSLNDDLRAALPNAGPDGNDAANLPKHYRVQMQQQTMVSGATRVLFTASDGEDDDRHCWFYPDPELAAEILAGWRQFDADLAAYTPPTAATAVVAAPVQALPTVIVQVAGTITITDNFATFEKALRDFLEHRLIRQPKTDQDFADLDVQIKAMKGAEAALESAETQMLAQIQAVDTAKKAKDMLARLVRDNRLMAEKLLASEKERRRGEIVAAGVTALREHIAALNKRLGQAFMPVIPADFGGAIRGKKSLSSMEDAVATELARAKIAANETADRIQINMQALVAAGDGAAFPDAAVLVLKAPDDCRAVIAQRVAETERKLAEQRERIRAEEQAKAEKAARAAQEAEDALIASIQDNAKRIEFDSVPYIQKAINTFESGAKDFENDPRPRVVAAIAAAREQMNAKLEAARAREQQAAEAEKPALPPAAAPIASPAVVSQAPAANSPIPAANVVPMVQRQAPAPASPPTLTLGRLNERLGRMKVSAEDLRALGFEPAGRDRSAVLFHEAQFPLIVEAMVAHLRTVADQHQRQVA